MPEVYVDLLKKSILLYRAGIKKNKKNNIRTLTEFED